MSKKIGKVTMINNLTCLSTYKLPLIVVACVLSGLVSTNTLADDSPLLTLTKTVVNDNSGTAVDSDWTLSASIGSTTIISGIEGDVAVTSAVVSAGTYTLSDTTVVSGYDATTIACTGASDTNLSDGLTLTDHENVTCVFTSDDSVPTGNFILDDSDGAACHDLGGSLVGNNVFTEFDSGSLGFAVSGAADESPPGNPYSISLTGADYNIYSQTGFGEWTVVSNLQNARNSSQQDGGIYDPVNGIPGRFFHIDPDSDTAFPSVSITGLTANDLYEVSFWAADSENAAGNVSRVSILLDNATVFSTPNIDNGADNATLLWKKYSFVVTATSTTADIVIRIVDENLSAITNTSGRDIHMDEIQIMECNIPTSPKLTLVNEVINDDGGDAIDTDWTLVASDGTTTATGKEGDSTITSALIDAGTYTLSALSGQSDYTQTSLSCTGAADTNLLDGLTLVDGEDVTCTFVHDDDDITLPPLAQCDANPPNYSDFTFSTITDINGNALDASNIGVGGTWLYPNVIDYFGESVGIKGEVLSLVGETALSTVEVTATGNANIVLKSLSKNISTTESYAEIQWTFVRSSDGTEIPISTEIGFNDIDRNDGVGASSARLESILIDRNAYDGYTLANPNTIDVSSDGIVDRFDGKANLNSDPSQSILFTIKDRSTFTWTQRIEKLDNGLSTGSAGFNTLGFLPGVTGCDRYDFSDAESYPEAQHNAFSDFLLGTSIDAESAAKLNATATADNDDGVTPPALTQGQTSSINVTVTESNQGDGYLQAWIDFDGSQTFEASEQIALNLQDDGNGNDLTAGDGIINFNIVVPVDAVTTQTIARFRWSTTEDLDSDTVAPNGEVEDYAVTISVLTEDYGDAPASYDASLTGGSAAAHTISSNIFLGNNLPDAEAANQPDVTDSATGDDTNGVDDEDGVTSFDALTDQDKSYRVVVNVTNNTGSAGRLIGWIDFDGNGTFDSDEGAGRVVATGTTAGNVTLTWPVVPVDIQPGITYLRVRFTTDALNSGQPTGLKADGEVEDYLLTVTSGGATISGRVYIDVNSNGVDNTEAGIGGTVVVLRDTATGTCQSVTTTGSGAYSFTDLADGTYTLYQADGETTPIPQSCDGISTNPVGYQSTTSDSLTVVINAGVITATTNSDGDAISDQNFGEVAGVTFEPNNQSAILPGNVTFYSHVFTTEADGEVDFSASSLGDNVTNGWSHVIYEDADCNGELNAAEASTPVTSIDLVVAAGETTAQACIINKVFAPTNAVNQDRYTVVTSAEFTYAGGTISDTTVLTVTDVTVTSERDSSSLELTKTVENVTLGSAETATLNEANPGNILTYRIYYRNTGTGPITDLVINDSAPSYTSIVSNSAGCTINSSSLTCPSAVIASEDIAWVFDSTSGNSLNGGESGVASYSVQIDQ